MFIRPKGFDWEETAHRFNLTEYQLTSFMVKNKFMTINNKYVVKVAPVLLQNEYLYFDCKDDVHFKNGSFRNKADNLIYLVFTESGLKFLEQMLELLRPKI